MFWYQVHYDMHVRTHTREHLYYCSQCNYSSITKNCLKRHVIQKHSNILLKCPTEHCDYSTPDKYKLQAHLKVHTDLVSNKPNAVFVWIQCLLQSVWSCVVILEDTAKGSYLCALYTLLGIPDLQQLGIWTFSAVSRRVCLYPFSLFGFPSSVRSFGVWESRIKLVLLLLYFILWTWIPFLHK